MHTTPPPLSNDAGRRVLYYKFAEPKTFDWIPAGCHYNDVLFRADPNGHVATPRNQPGLTFRSEGRSGPFPSAGLVRVRSAPLRATPQRSARTPRRRARRTAAFGDRRHEVEERLDAADRRREVRRQDPLRREPPDAVEHPGELARGRRGAATASRTSPRRPCRRPAPPRTARRASCDGLGEDRAERVDREEGGRALVEDARRHRVVVGRRAQRRERAVADVEPVARRERVHPVERHAATWCSCAARRARGSPAARCGASSMHRLRLPVWSRSSWVSQIHASSAGSIDRARALDERRPVDAEAGVDQHRLLGQQHERVDREVPTPGTASCVGQHVHVGPHAIWLIHCPPPPSGP